MRQFEKFLTDRLQYKKILHIDLSWATHKRSSQEIQLGIKTDDGEWFNWQGGIIHVESDFTVSEFIAVCSKYKIQHQGGTHYETDPPG